MLRNRDPAPGFTLPDFDNRPRSLADLRKDRPFLLLFFRHTECPTSRRDLAAYVEAYDRITGFRADMAAVSSDSVGNHKRLVERLGAPFPVLSDPGFAVSESFGVYRSDDGEEPDPHGEPAVFIVDVDGRIAYIQVQTGPKGAARPDAMALVLYYMSQHGGKY